MAESDVSGTTAVTTPRSWREELSGLTSQRKSSGARGVVKTDATRLRGRMLLTYSGFHSSPPGAPIVAYDVNHETVAP